MDTVLVRVEADRHDVPAGLWQQLLTEKCLISIEKMLPTGSAGEYTRIMRYKQQHAGKWVAVKGNKVIAISKDFAPLQKKVATRKDARSVRFALVPKGMITGVL